MKYLLIIGDGMADYPIPELDYMTPLQVAKKPNMNIIATKGQNGLLKTIPKDLTPGSGTAILSILGYDPKIYYSGRGPFEAAARNIKLSTNDVAYRCNLITEKDNKIIDYSADHITNNEAAELIKTLSNKIEKQKNIEFFEGLGYRHFLIIRNYIQSEIIKCTPPHDAIGMEINKILPKAKTSEAETIAETLSKMIINSKKVLENHSINISRIKLGKKPANMIWPWSGGRKTVMPSFKEKYNITSAVISAVDIVKGIGVYAGMKNFEVPGATGLYNTNYEGKADFALSSLEKYDMVIIHIESPDEAGHSRDYKLKVKTIEDIDKRFLGRLLNGLDEEYTIAILPDHPTPIRIGTHTKDPVPFTIFSPNMKADKVKEFDEESVKEGRFGTLEGEQFMLRFLGKTTLK